MLATATKRQVVDMYQKAEKEIDEEARFEENAMFTDMMKAEVIHHRQTAIKNKDNWKKTM